MNITDLFADDDGMYMGTPKSKFFDIVFNANRGLVEDELEDLVERIALLEMILAEAQVENIDQKMQEIKYNNSADLEEVKFDLFVSSMGNILTKNE
jgi:hypothetical protein